MASRNSSSKGPGWLATMILIGLVLFVIFWSLSTVGYVLGLTPTYSEAFDSPEGWVDRHYRAVVWGYVLTVAAIATVAALVWLGLRMLSDDPARAAQAREWLRPAQASAVALALAIVFLPIGKRPGVDTGAAAVGPAREGNVPDLVGMSAARAEEALDRRNLGAEFRQYPSDDERCKVVSQNPAPASEVEEYGEVALRCVMPVPKVVGRKALAAEGRLFDAGLNSRFINEPADYDLSRCRVKSQSKHGSAAPDATVKLRLRCTKPKPDPAPAIVADAAPEPASECDPNYEGACLDPNSADYDCEGGEGDGPDYTGPVTVVGEDHYDLNRDPEEDSLACETS